jgi:hypothetical protein
MTITGYSLESHLIEFEENLEGGGETGCLYFTPEPAFVAADTVHDPSDITEVCFELFFEDLSMP